jgi:UDP-N-acetylglucosamine acyltransferase
VIEGHTTIGTDCAIYPFASLGTPPQDMQYKGEPTELIIGDHNIIREHVTMNIASNKGDGVTRVGNHCMFMIGIHIGHDCQIGDYVVMANQATLGGHVKLGEYSIIGGLTAVHQFVNIGEHAMIGGMSRIVNDVIPFGVAKGVSAHLAGLNLVGLRRRGFERDDIFELRKAYRILFVDEGTMEERIYNTESMFSDSEPVMRMIDFIRGESKRTLLTEQTV